VHIVKGANVHVTGKTTVKEGAHVTVEHTIKGDIEEGEVEVITNVEEVNEEVNEEVKTTVKKGKKKSKTKNE